MTKSWTSILWAVQSKLKQEDSTVHLIKAFQKFGLNWAAFPLIPFATGIPEFSWDGPIIYYGSTKLIQLVEHDPVLKAGAAFFYSPVTHSVSWYGPRFGSDYLNAGARVITVAEALGLSESEEFFIRPEAGVKLFGGGVMNVSKFKAIVDSRPSLGPGMSLDMETRVYVNDVLPIEHEVRTWFIGGKLAAVVGYRRNGRTDPWLIEEGEDFYGEVKEFALAQGEKISSEVGACVLDVAITPVGLKVVEINCIHTSGFYVVDVIEGVVAELTNYVREME